MLTDHLCAVSWRARPRSFVSLMTLYESNFIRLGWLVGDPRQLPSSAVSEVAGDCPLELAVTERAPYTTTATLSYADDQSGPYRGRKKPAFWQNPPHAADPRTIGVIQRLDPFDHLDGRL